jgi:leucine zipper transcription factor-like protein 1
MADDGSPAEDGGGPKGAGVAPENLTPFHQKQLEEYLRFARYKREEHLRDIGVVFDDTRDSQLTDEHFTRDEVDVIMTSLQDAIRANVDKELTHVSSVNTLLLKSMFTQAEEIMLDLHADTKHLENERLLREIRNFEEVCIEREKNPKLAALSAATTGDAALRHNIDRLKDRNQTLAERFKELQRVHIQSAKEKTALQEELEHARRAASGEGAAAHADELARLQGEAESLREKAAAAEARASALEKDLTRKVQATAPFRNMRTMLSKKNQQLKMLREALVKYEPDTVEKLAELDIVDDVEDVDEDDGAGAGAGTAVAAKPRAKKASASPKAPKGPGSAKRAGARRSSTSPSLSSASSSSSPRTPRTAKTSAASPNNRGGSSPKGPGPASPKAKAAAKAKAGAGVPKISGRRRG